MKALLPPLFAQVALTFALTGALALSRVQAAQAGAVRLGDVALSSDPWPTRVRQIGNAYGNQFEQPMLFYLLVVLALITGRDDGVLIAGAWLYVLARCAHAYVHVTSNNVLTRFQLFAASVAILVVMWIWLAVRSLAG